MKPSKKSARRRWQAGPCCRLLLAGVLLRLFVDPEDGDTAFLEKAGSFTELQGSAFQKTILFKLSGHSK
jgi:hypothetical protein